MQQGMKEEAMGKKLLLAFLLAVAVLGAARADLPPGAAPPAFIGGAQDWINTPPLTWKALRGKVVLIDFWEYTCVNCIRTDPYLKAWYERYQPYGFVIVGIQTPEFGFSAIKANVEAAAKRAGLKYPILNDPASKNWTAYHENFWPSKYLFDQSGHLVLQHAGEGAYQDTERAIQRLLRKTHPDAKFPAVLPPQTPWDEYRADCRDDTPELYANPAYGFLANLPDGWERDKASTFSDRTRRHSDGKIYANGPFFTRYQSLQHARATKELQDYILIQYHGTEVNVVVNRPSDRDYKVYALLDGNPIPKASRGDDVKDDARGTYFAVDEPRMFNVIRSAYGSHELKLASDSPDFDLYSYTFSGCPQKWRGKRASEPVRFE
jgi:thiol-disulfide isomerase/thioredoxin